MLHNLMGKFKVSLAEIAEKAGVSTSAVSLALRNSPKVSAKRKEEIARIAADLGYVQDPRIAELMKHLRSSRGERKTATLGVIVPQLRKAQWDQFPPLKLMLKGIEEQASKLGYGIDLFVLEELQARNERLKGIIEARGITGVIMLPFKKGVESVDIDFEGLSVVTGGYSIVSPNLNRVVPNYLQMMDEILEELCARGYRRIGMIMTYTRAGGGNGRKLLLSSYLFYQSLIADENVVPVLQNRNATPQGIHDWLTAFQPEVVISSAALKDVIEDLGFRIPNKLGFVSIDLSEPPFDLAGVDHRWDWVGSECVRMLVTDIHSSETGVPKRPKILMVDSHFKTGDSIRKVGEPVEIKVRNIPDSSS